MESRVFLTGIWKNYQELEESISMPELLAILEAQHNQDYENKKFAAALKGVNLDEQAQSGPDPWEAMKARVASKGGTNDPNDILSLQGGAATQAGFGIGLGLEYEALG